MTKFQVPRSLLVSTDLFDIEVAAFAKEHRDWLEREAKVREEEGRADIAPIDRHHRYPAPTAHELIMKAVDLETGQPNYEYLDDRPTPDQVLAQRKAALVQELVVAETAAREAVVPVSKARLFGLRISAISHADADRHRKVHGKYVGLLQKLKIKDVDHQAMKDEVRAMRSDDDNKFVDDMAERQKVLDAIALTAAQAHSDIDDLTLETIDAYQLPKF